MAAVLADSLAAGALGLSTSFIDQDRHGHAVPSRAADDDELRALIEVLGRAPGHAARPRVPPVDQGDRPPNARHRPGRALVRRRRRGVHLEPARGEQPRPVARRTHHRAGARAARRRLSRVRAGLAAAVQPQRQLRPDPGVRGRARVGKADHADARRQAAHAGRRRVADTGPRRLGPRRRRVHHLPGLAPRPRAPHVGARTGRSASSAARSPTWSRRAVATRRTCSPTGCSSTTSRRAWWRKHCRTTIAGKVSTLILDPTTVVGASDAGAHLQMMCGAGDSTLLLTEHVRDRGDLTVEGAVHQLTGRLADAFGIRGRGVLRARARRRRGRVRARRAGVPARAIRHRPPGWRTAPHPAARRLPHDRGRRCGHSGAGHRDRRAPGRTPRRGLDAARRREREEAAPALDVARVARSLTRSRPACGRCTARRGHPRARR